MYKILHIGSVLVAAPFLLAALLEAQSTNHIYAEIASDTVVISEPVVLEPVGYMTLAKSDYRANARQLLRNTPLANYSDVFFDNARKPEDAALAIAIAGAESSFGKYPAAAKHYNAWGYFCNRPNKTSKLDCGWTGEKGNWSYSIKRYMQVMDNRYFSKFDGSYESLNKAFGGKYCVSGCEHWNKNVWGFYTSIIK